jgi:hypothetical protein
MLLVKPLLRGVLWVHLLEIPKISQINEREKEVDETTSETLLA